MDSTGRRDSGPAVCQSHRVPLDCAVCLARHSGPATPIEFHSIAPSVWRGTVVPLDQRISLYIFISSKDGKMTATISNPEANFFRRRVYTVTRDQSQVYLEANGKKIEGTLDEKAGTLSLQ